MMDTFHKWLRRILVGGVLIGGMAYCSAIVDQIASHDPDAELTREERQDGWTIGTAGDKFPPGE
jgi:hypothetical protein